MTSRDAYPCATLGLDYPKDGSFGFLGLTIVRLGGFSRTVSNRPSQHTDPGRVLRIEVRSALRLMGQGTTDNLP